MTSQVRADAPLPRRTGFWLRMARERAGLSQGDAAEGIGLARASASSVAQWESGDRMPALNTIHALATLYKVPLTLFTEPMLTAYEVIDDELANPRSPRYSGVEQSPATADASEPTLDVMRKYREQLESVNRAVAELNAAAPRTITEYLSDEAKAISDAVRHIWTDFDAQRGQLTLQEHVRQSTPPESREQEAHPWAEARERASTARP